MIRCLPRLLAALLLVAALPALASCYVPDRFRAEIRIARNGDFTLDYKGILTWAPLYMEIAAGKYSEAEAQEKIEGIRRDLKRDSQFTSIRSIGRGQFEVAYRRTGNYVANPGMVSFVRRNARILNIDARPDGTVTVFAETPNIDKARPMAEAGLLVRGSLRVISDMKVSGASNANATYKDPNGDWTVYDWSLDGTAPTYPTITFRR